MRQPPAQIQQADLLAQRQFQALLEWARQVDDIPVLDGHLVEDVDITAGTRTVVRHGLGRSLRGYIVVRRNGSAIVYDETADEPSEELWLQAGANVTVTIYVF